MEDKVRRKKWGNYGRYLAIGAIMWVIGFASFGAIINLRGLRIGEILFVVWGVYMIIGWIVFGIGCVKRFKYKYYL